MPHHRRSIAVVGLGTFGTKLAMDLSRFGDRVLGIDVDPAAVSRLADHIDRAIIADGAEKKALTEAGLQNYDVVVVAMSSDLESNLLTVMNALAVGSCEVWVKAASDTHARILSQIGVSRILHPESSFAELLAQQLHNPRVRGSVKIGPDLHVATISAPDKVCGRSLRDLKLVAGEDEPNCVGVMRNNSYHPPTPEFELAEGDDVLLIGGRDGMRQFADQ